jgi:hypothetical protein
MNDLMALVAIFTGLCLVLGIAGWLSDRWLERNKPLPPPTKRSIVGEEYKPWM